MTLVYNIFYHLALWIAKLVFRHQAIGGENVPESGGLIIAVNHTSYFDPPLAGICCHRGIFFLARKNLLNWPVLGKLFPQMNVIPVERDGNDRSALKAVIHKISEGEAVMLFPEGTRSPDGRLQRGQPGIGLVVAKTGAPVLPMRIFGAYEAFPKHSKRIHLTPITVVIGKPLRFGAEDFKPASRETYQKISDRIMDAIAALELPPALRNTAPPQHSTDSA